MFPVCCSVLQCVAVCCSALQCVAVRCSVLQCVAVCSLDRFVCFDLYSPLSPSSCPFKDILHCLPRAVGVPLESALNLVSLMRPCGAHDTHACCAQSNDHLSVSLQHLYVSLQHLSVSLQHLSVSLQHLYVSHKHTHTHIHTHKHTQTHTNKHHLTPSVCLSSTHLFPVSICLLSLDFHTCRSRSALSLTILLFACQLGVSVFVGHLNTTTVWCLVGIFVCTYIFMCHMCV